MAQAKEKNKVNEKSELIEEEKKPGIFQKLFFLVVIPLLFIVAIFLALATFTNFNVFEKAQDILPFSKDESKDVSVNIKGEGEIVKLQAEIKEKEAEIDQLKSEIEKLNEEKQNSEIKQEQLQFEMDKLKQEQSEAKKEQAEIIRTFENMSAKKAAPILVEMKEEEALKILSSLKADTLSKILANMDPQQAAKFTEKLQAEE